MQFFSWPSIIFYCLFSTFVFHQRLHSKNFQGASSHFEMILNTSLFFSYFTGIAYLIYYGWSVVWWVPIVIYIIDFLAIFIINIFVIMIGSVTVSICGFIGWPICAYFMFSYIPVFK
jgi:hypothetical protein